MTRRRVATRPRRTTCPDCGRTIGLADCGVVEHRRTRTRREQLDGRCPGRVYIHLGTGYGYGGIDCPPADQS